MKNLQSFFPEDLYPQYLSVVQGIPFTHREIDVAACLLNARKTSKIAQLLSIDPRTVETHIRNVMLKLECNTREGIIDFLETSDKLPLLRKHYFHLQVEYAFEKSLKNISQLTRKEPSIFILMNGVDQYHNSPLLPLLKTHLKLAGLKVSNSAPTQESYPLIYFLHSGLENIPSSYAEIINQHPREKILLLFTTDKKNPVLPKELTGFDFISLIKHPSYYFYFYDVLKKLCPSIKIDSIISNFKDKYEKIHKVMQPEHPHHSPQAINRKDHDLVCQIRSFVQTKQWVNSITLFMGLIAICFFSFQWNSEHKTHSIVSAALTIPGESVFLERPEVLQQIDKSFNKQKGIQTVALIGMGGAGKTTLARQYARQQNSNAIWEINAETKENLRNSFEKLAEHLAKTEEEGKILRSIQEIKDPISKEEKIKVFVQERLRSHPRWCLIYDNVEQFSDLHEYFPQDDKLWGKGKVILTTRNINIQNNSQVNGVVTIGELSPKEKLELFTKILSHGSSQLFTSAQLVEIITFLKCIPSFPLDVSVAGYYLKSTNISYENYLKNLENCNHEFVNVQENLLKEAGTYLKTRYSIIVLSLEQIMTRHKDFRDLLLLISLLDSQNIPKNILNKYKGESIVDNFIYHLNKYSLVSHDSSQSVLSIHRSTQAIISAYLVKKLNLKKGDNLIKEITDILTGYAFMVIEENIFSKIKKLLPQYEAFLNHKDLLDSDLEISIQCTLGSMYGWLHEFAKAKNIIENNIIGLESSKNYNVLAPTLICFAMIERESRNYEKAKVLLEKSVLIYENYLPAHSSGFARALGYLGDVYKKLEDYERSKFLLHKSLKVYNTKISTDYAGIAKSLTYLGLVYRQFGDYEKSKSFLEQALMVYKKHFSENHNGYADVLCHLGNTYRVRGEYEKGKDFLENSHRLCKKLYSEDGHSVAWSSFHLGRIFWDLGKYEGARSLLEKSLVFFRKNPSINSGWLAMILLDLGRVEKELGHNKKANNLLKGGLLIHKEKYSKDKSQNLTYLIELGSYYKSLGFYKEAAMAFIKAERVYKEKFKKDDPWKIGDITSQLGDIYKNLRNYAVALSYFSQALAICEKYYGKTHLKTAQALLELGQAYFLKGEIDSAEKFIQRALNIFEQSRHPQVYKCLENLSEIYQQKCDRAKAQGLAVEMENFNKESLNYLKQALDVAKAHFPEDSSHINRIQSKLRTLEQR